MYVSLATINSVTVAFDRLYFVVCRYGEVSLALI